jgi:hypothetical protein
MYLCTRMCVTLNIQILANLKLNSRKNLNSFIKVVTPEIITNKNNKAKIMQSYILSVIHKSKLIYWEPYSINLFRSYDV